MGSRERSGDRAAPNNRSTDHHLCRRRLTRAARSLDGVFPTVGRRVRAGVVEGVGGQHLPRTRAGYLYYPD